MTTTTIRTHAGQAALPAVLRALGTAARFAGYFVLTLLTVVFVGGAYVKH